MNTKPLTQPIRQIIFDCDGVLVDSEILASQTVLRMLKPYGFAMDLEEYSQRFAGKVEEDTLAIVRDEYHIQLPSDFASRLRPEIEQRLDHELQPVAGMKETISGLSLPKAVVSNSRLKRVIASLKTTGLSGLFGDDLFAVDMVSKPKPAPDLYEYAAAQLGRSPAECLVVEDSPSGVMAAHRAGMPVVGFLGASHIPPGHGDALMQAGARTTVADAEALKQLFATVLPTNM